MKIKNNEPKAYDLSNNEYFSLFTHVSRSEMFKSLKSENGVFETVPEKKTFTFGRAFHTRVLEPNKFNKQFFVQPEGVRLNNDLKEQAGKRGILNFRESKMIHLMNASVTKNEFFQSVVLAPTAHIEKCFFCDDKESGLALKAKLDICDPDKGIIVDLKSARSCEPRDVKYAIRDYNLLGQAYFYNKVLGQCYGFEFDFYFAFVEKKLEFPETLIVSADRKQVNTIGRGIFLHAAKRYKEQIARGPGYVNNEPISVSELMEL